MSRGEGDVSADLAAGIAAVNARVAALVESLGGYGASACGYGPDGVPHRGTLVSASTQDQGPYILDAAGRRWRCARLRGGA